MDYDEMLDRGIEQAPEIQPDSDRLDVPDPDVRQEGNVTVFENFRDVCQELSRGPDHVMKFLQDELGTSAHIDESNRARFTGDFGARRISDALEAYTEEYVLCSECGLPDTSFEREQGAELLVCAACGARSPT